jgi:hypothetical protein
MSKKEIDRKLFTHIQMRWKVRENERERKYEGAEREKKMRNRKRKVRILSKRL